MPKDTAVTIEMLARKVGVDKKVVELLVEEIKCSLIEGKRVQLTRFGSFQTATLKARRFDKTGVEGWSKYGVVEVPERQTLRFRISKKFKEELELTGRMS